MDIVEADRIKHRQIFFSELHPDPEQARRAALLLADLPGILRAQPTALLVLDVSYDLAEITLQQIDEALREIGLHLDNHLVNRVKRALYYYTEETFRANCGCIQGKSNCTKQIFAKRYARLDHACRDHRPEHWRRYL